MSERIDQDFCIVRKLFDPILRPYRVQQSIDRSPLQLFNTLDQISKLSVWMLLGFYLEVDESVSGNVFHNARSHQRLIDAHDVEFGVEIDANTVGLPEREILDAIFL